VTLPDLSPELLAALAGALVAAGAGAAGLWAWRRHRVRRALLDKIESIATEYLRDVLLPDGNGGWFHVDFLLLTGVGLIVIDLRDVHGLIFGSEQMTEWTVMQKSRRFTFPNPLGPLYDRMAVVRALVGDSVPVDGRVVFTDRGSFPKGHPRPVTRLASLATEIPPLAVVGSAELLSRLRPAWEQVKSAASPSPLKRR
jgi:hypothetical protein